MEKLDKILKKSLAKKNLSGTAEAAQICFYAGEWGNGRFEPISFSKGTLKVSVSSSPAAQELQCQEAALLDFLNEKIGRNIVRSVRINVKW